MVTNRTALEKYEEKDPLWWCLYHKNTLSYLKLRVKQWQDAETEAKGWVVINSLRGGAAGGGTRMRVGLDQHEVTSLAKTMEVKFTRDKYFFHLIIF